MLPVISQDLALGKNQSASLLLAGLIVTPQIIAAILSPWIGYHSEKFGRKPLLLIGFGIEALRGLVFAVYTSYPALVIGQCLGGISAAAVTVLTVLMITDMTTGTGRFNLVQGFIGTVIAIAAAISTGASGFVFEKARPPARIFDSCCRCRCGHRAVVDGADRDQSPANTSIEAREKFRLRHFSAPNALEVTARETAPRTATAAAPRC